VTDPERGPGAAAGPFPGGTSVSRLAVYDWSSPDGLRGGSAHAHLACTEGYVVIGGRGRLQTLGHDGYAETTLTPLTVAWFSPGVIHRLVNDGDLRIIVVMQNSGLPEAGDCVLTLPPEHLTDPGAYQAATALDTTGTPAAAEAAAGRRKNLAVTGFLRLRDRMAADGPSALDEFYTAAAALVRAQLPAWRDTWERGVMAAARQTGAQIGALAGGDITHLHEGRLTVLGPPAEERLGNCGRLATYEPGRAEPG
jgi:mannose-6-phosphate isomerase-like protein (cupin superfamily)